MERFARKLKQSRTGFHRRVRRFALLAAVACFCVATVFFCRFCKQRDTSARRTLRETDPSPPGAQLLVLPKSKKDDPAQLIDPAVLYFSRHVSPVRTVGAGGEKVSVLDKDVLLKVLRAVRETPQEELRRRTDPTITWDDFDDTKRREEIKGRVCMFRGTLRRFAETKGVDLSEAGFDTLYEGQLQDRMGRLYSFYCFERPKREIPRSDVATLVGVFFKLIKYPTRRGEQLITPLIVARTIEAEPGARPPTPLTRRLVEETPAWVLWAVLGGLLLAAGILGIIRSRKDPGARR